MKKLIPGLMIVFVVLGIVAALLLRLPAVQNSLMEGVIKRQVASVPLQLFSGDALHVLLCGTASSLPSSKRAGPCVAIIVGGKFYIVDAGVRSTNNIGLFRLPGELIGGVFITHHHSEHIGGLGELNMNTWVQGREEALRVFGPPGIQQVVDGFTQAYGLDRTYGVSRRGSETGVNPNSALKAMSFEIDAPQIVLEENGLKVTMFPVEHQEGVPSVGYRFDYKGRSVVVSGDTVKSSKVVAAAKGVDLLVHEAMAMHIIERMESAFAAYGNDTLSNIMHEIRDYHASPVEAAEVANEAGVTELVLTHLVPSPPNAVAERLFMRGVSDTRSKGVTLGYDCLMYTLPANSKEISRQCLARAYDIN